MGDVLGDHVPHVVDTRWNDVSRLRDVCQHRTPHLGRKGLSITAVLLPRHHTMLSDLVKRGTEYRGGWLRSDERVEGRQRLQTAPRLAVGHVLLGHQLRGEGGGDSLVTAQLRG